MTEARTFFELPVITKKKYSIRPTHEDERGGWVCLEQEIYVIQLCVCLRACVHACYFRSNFMPVLSHNMHEIASKVLETLS